MEELYYFGQILLAILLGAILGIQRERWGRAAGPRTYGLVSGGAAMFTILASKYFFNFQGAGAVAAGVVTGIGFLGAGMILHKKDRVEGLTTAAGLWMTAGIGMAVGVRFFILSVCTTLAILLLLMLNDKALICHSEEIEKRNKPKKTKKEKKKNKK